MFKKSILSIIFLSLLMFQGCFEDKKAQEVNSIVSSNEYVLTSTDTQQYVIKKDG